MLGIFLDLETTGLDSYRHSVLEIALRVLDLATGIEVGRFESIVSQDTVVWEKRDLMAIEINGFRAEDLPKGMKPEKIQEEIISLFTKLQIQRGKSVFICANPSFDRSFFSQLIPVYTQEKLNWPYHWFDLASMYWALLVKKQQMTQHAFPETMSFSKDSIAESCALAKEQKPHRAMQGVDHLLICYQHIVGFLDF